MSDELKLLLDARLKHPLLHRKLPLGCCCDCLLRGCVIHQKWRCDPSTSFIPELLSGQYLGFWNIQAFWGIGCIGDEGSGFYWPKKACDRMERICLEYDCRSVAPLLGYSQAVQYIHVWYFFPYWWDGEPPEQHNYTALKCEEDWTEEAINGLRSHVMENNLYYPQCYPELGSPGGWEELCDNRDLYTRVRRVRYYYCEYDEHDNPIGWKGCLVTHIGTTPVKVITNGTYNTLPLEFPYLTAVSPASFYPFGAWKNGGTQLLAEKFDRHCTTGGIDERDPWRYLSMSSLKTQLPNNTLQGDIWAFIVDVAVSGTSVYDPIPGDWKHRRRCDWTNWGTPVALPPTSRPPPEFCVKGSIPSCEDITCEWLMENYPYQLFWNGWISFKKNELCDDNEWWPYNPDDLPEVCKSEWPTHEALCTSTIEEVGQAICDINNYSGKTLVIKKGNTLWEAGRPEMCIWHYVAIDDPEQEWYQRNLDCLSCIEEAIEIYSGEEFCGTLIIQSYQMDAIVCDAIPQTLWDKGRGDIDWMWICYTYNPADPELETIQCTSKPIWDEETQEWVPEIPGTGIIRVMAPDLFCEDYAGKYWCEPQITCKLTISYACCDVLCGDCWYSTGAAGAWHEIDREAECVTMPVIEAAGWYSQPGTGLAYYVAYYPCIDEPPPLDCAGCNCSYLLEKDIHGEYVALPETELLDPILHPESRPPPDGDLNECPEAPEATTAMATYLYREKAAEGYPDLPVSVMTYIAGVTWQTPIDILLTFQGIVNGKCRFTGWNTRNIYKRWYQYGWPFPASMCLCSWGDSAELDDSDGTNFIADYDSTTKKWTTGEVGWAAKTFDGGCLGGTHNECYIRPECRVSGEPYLYGIFASEWDYLISVVH